METVYWVLAIGGSSLFFVKMVLLLLGADGGTDADVADVADFGDASGDSDLGDADDGGDSHAAFRLLTLQSLSAFAMGAGWMGITALQSLQMTEAESIFPAVVVGAAFVGLLGFLLNKALGLESSGTLKPESALGSQGSVYLEIPETGRGQVQIEVQGRLATLDATSRRVAIPTGTRVRVEAVEPDGTLVVSPV